jgi:hypothetical protein
MSTYLTEIGLILQILGVIPPIVPAVRSEKRAARATFESTMDAAEKYGMSRRDQVWILGGFVLVALGAGFQFVALCCSK